MTTSKDMLQEAIIAEKQGADANTVAQHRRAAFNLAVREQGQPASAQPPTGLPGEGAPMFLPNKDGTLGTMTSRQIEDAARLNSWQAAKDPTTGRRYVEDNAALRENLDQWRQHVYSGKPLSYDVVKATEDELRKRSGKP